MKKRVNPMKAEEETREAAMMDLRVNLKIEVNLKIDLDEDRFCFPLKKMVTSTLR